MKKKIKNGKEYIFDVVRKKYIQNQPEEWVRQHIIEYLNKEKGYPISLMSIEKKNPINSMNKRCDIICSDNNGNPLLLIECKAGHVKLNTQALNQSIMYQKKIKAKYILLTNGNKNYCFKIKENDIIVLKTIPSYQDIVKNKV
tara:strand:- start:2587 stop:3015 length:429 start_codon:yes stop_codon:yes gene_type:complete